MKFRRALVTGGAGFIGSHIVKSLLKIGVEVAILDNLSMGKMENVPPEAIFIRGDILNDDDLRKSLSDVDVIFHEAAKVRIRSPLSEFYSDTVNNFMGTLNILKICKDTNVKKFIFASSMAVYADSPSPNPIKEDYTQEPLSLYGTCKLVTERYCLNILNRLNIDCIVLRYFNTYGSGQTYTPYVGVITIFVKRLLEGKVPVIYGDGEQQRDFIYVVDVAKANILAMESDVRNEIFNIGTGKGTSVNEIASLICKKMGSNIQPTYCSEQLGELKFSVADVTKAKKLLGFQTVGRLEDKVNEVIDYIKKQETIVRDKRK